MYSTEFRYRLSNLSFLLNIHGNFMYTIQYITPPYSIYTYCIFPQFCPQVVKFYNMWLYWLDSRGIIDFFLHTVSDQGNGLRIRKKWILQHLLIYLINKVDCLQKFYIYLRNNYYELFKFYHANLYIHIFSLYFPITKNKKRF